MNGETLLDTNAVIGFLNGDAGAASAVTAAKALLPIVVVGELYYGVFKSAQSAKNLARLQESLTSVNLLDCDLLTSEHYGRIKNNLRAIGKPIPNNDLWIAAIAVQHELPLLSRDAHFDAVPGLTRASW